MKVLYLAREAYKTHTYGTLICENEILHTIERPWRQNSSNISCIPSGLYTVRFMKRSASGKYRDVWHLQAVPGRSGILIHNGNLARHSRGCLILGSKKGNLGGMPAVLASRPALRKMKRLVGVEPFQLQIIGGTYA